MSDITAVILTFNEEKNISDCINSVKGLVKRIIVIDSFSSDKTVAIAKSLGAEVYEHEFENYSKQYIYGINVANITTQWIFRIDADERLSNESATEIAHICDNNTNTDISGIIVRFEVCFLGKKLKHGGIYPFKKLLVYKKDKGKMEERWMDEHIILLDGRAVELKSDSYHHDFKDLTAWIDKHNKYSSREVQDYKNRKSINDNQSKKGRFKSFLKFSIYYKLPMGMRAHLYYWYRYYFRLGFLDGKEGKIFCFLQAYWYRFLVDAKIYESEKHNSNA